MATEIIVNTGPLIALAKMDALSVIGRLPFRFISPREVYDELRTGELLGFLKIVPEWLEMKALSSSVTPLALTSLDLGESAVIQLAMERQARWVCIDEWKARRAALSAGLGVVGALGLLAKAKTAGLVETISPYIEKAVEEGVRYHPDLVSRILAAVGEA